MGGECPLVVISAGRDSVCVRGGGVGVGVCVRGCVYVCTRTRVTACEIVFRCVCARTGEGAGVVILGLWSPPTSGDHPFGKEGPFWSQESFPRYSGKKNCKRGCISRREGLDVANKDSLKRMCVPKRWLLLLMHVHFPDNKHLGRVERIVKRLEMWRQRTPGTFVS